MLKIRPVKGENSKELQQTHIHITTYDDKFHHMSVHYANEGESLLARKHAWAIQQALRDYVVANTAYQDSWSIDEESVIRTKGEIKDQARSKLYDAIKACPFVVLLDTSCSLELETPEELDDEYNFDLIDRWPDDEEKTDSGLGYTSNPNGYFSGSII